MQLNKKRYNDLDTYLKKKYGKKIIKLPLDGNFTCPNRDGTLSDKGCIFCSEKGAGERANKTIGDIKSQIVYQKNLLKKENRDEGYIAYFQNFTNTYGDIDKMQKMFYAAIKEDDIVGLSIATRADCLSDEVLDLLTELNKICDLTVELGLQSINEDTIRFINRGYTHEEFDLGYLKLQKRGINTIAHLIIGLPDEDMDDYLSAIKYINQKKFWGIKIHNLYVEDDTSLKYYYEKNNIDYKMSKDQYANIVVEMLRNLNSGIVINRLTGDGISENIAYPKRSKDKGSVLSTIDKIMKDYDYIQGDLCQTN